MQSSLQTNRIYSTGALNSPAIAIIPNPDCTGLNIEFLLGGNPFYNTLTSLIVVVENTELGISYTSDELAGTDKLILRNGTGKVEGLVTANVITGTVSSAFLSEIDDGDYIYATGKDYPIVVNSKITDSSLISQYALSESISASTYKIFTPIFQVPASEFDTPTPLTVLPSGTYTVTVTYIFGSTTQVTVEDVIVNCYSNCCVSTKMLDLINLTDNYKSPENMNKILEYMSMWGLYKTLVDADCMRNQALADKISAKLDAFCNQSNCKNC